jgi:hypothetical protein
MKRIQIGSTALAILLAGAGGLAWTGCAQAASREVAAAFKPDAEWKNYPTRTLADLPANVTAHTDTELSRYGGRLAHQGKSSGFFRAEKVGGRWWLVDPDGCLFLHKGVASVRMTDTPGAVAALNGKFGSVSNWAEQTSSLLRENGFNALGGWCDTATLRKATRPLVYTRLWNFMGSYGRKRGGTFQQAGHLGYPNDCIFVFDPEFESFCDDYAKQLAATKDDPWLLGHFSDNELPFKREALKNYLQLPATDAGHVAAKQFLTQRHGTRAMAKDITAQDEQDFLGLVAARYFDVVSRAIRKHDPNHLYLGSRFYGSDLRFADLFEACGPYVDVVSVNWYRAWTPDADKLAMWARESGRPVIITEWYAKAMDSGMANTSGAGWLVKTQGERGMFYQNFALALLESKVCVGWDWFRYMDNDPDDKKVDPSNRDSNKGILNNRYAPYEPLLEAMKELNLRAYSLVDYFDARPRTEARNRTGDVGD